MMKESKLPDSVIVELMGWQKSSGSSLIDIYSDLDESETLGDYFDDDGIKKDIKAGTIEDIGGNQSYSRRER